MTRRADDQTGNLDATTVAGFGAEWAAFDQTRLTAKEQGQIFEKYFSLFPFEALPESAEGFDLGCGSGRWAEPVAKNVARLHCIDASREALDVARRRLEGQGNVVFHEASVDNIPLPDGSQDFGYSLGVLHHIPDTRAGLASCARKLKPGAPFLVYLYYRFDNRPAWFHILWRFSNWGRTAISRLPFRLKRLVCEAIAATVYWPLARLAGVFEALGANVESWPLSAYRNNSFYTMRTDALDRLGTRLERRFTRQEIKDMMEAAGLEKISFREEVPHWVAIGWRANDPG